MEKNLKMDKEMLRAVLLSCRFHDDGKENTLHNCRELL